MSVFWSKPKNSGRFCKFWPWAEPIKKLKLQDETFCTLMKDKTLLAQMCLTFILRNLDSTIGHSRLWS
jgi:hypothetical protein